MSQSQLVLSVVFCVCVCVSFQSISVNSHKATYFIYFIFNKMVQWTLATLRHEFQSVLWQRRQSALKPEAYVCALGRVCVCVSRSRRNHTSGRRRVGGELVNGRARVDQGMKIGFGEKSQVREDRGTELRGSTDISDHQKVTPTFT